MHVFAVHSSGSCHFSSRQCCGLRLCHYERSLYSELSSPFSSKNSSDSSSSCSWSEYNQFWNDIIIDEKIIKFQMVLHCVNLRCPIKAIMELFFSVSFKIYIKGNLHRSNYNMLFCFCTYVRFHLLQLFAILGQVKIFVKQAECKVLLLSRQKAKHHNVEPWYCARRSEM